VISTPGVAAVEDVSAALDAAFPLHWCWNRRAQSHRARDHGASIVGNTEFRANDETLVPLVEFGDREIFTIVE